MCKHHHALVISYATIVAVVIANVVFICGLYHEITMLELDVKSDIVDFKVSVVILGYLRCRIT